MRIINCTLSALLLLTTAATASAQTATPDPISKQLDDQLRGAVGPHGTHLITLRALVLALAEAKAKAADPSEPRATELSAAINRQRTDLQLGTTSDSPQATSVLEKPGTADLLSLALDRGAIKKTAAGTGVTLSTTPYAIWTGFGKSDTPQLWKSAVVARNLSFSATFSSTDVTTKGDFSSFTSGEVKYIIAGNRSPRDPELLRGVRDKLGPIFRVADDALDHACGGLLKPNSSSEQDMNKWLQSHPDASMADARAQLNALVGPLTVDAVDLKRCVDVILESEQSISGGLDFVTDATKKYLTEQRRQQFSVAALFVRDATLSDYYAAKLLYGNDFRQVTVNANAEASWNRNSTTPAGVALRSLRAYSVEFGLNSKTLANGRLDGSLSSKASRDKAADAKSVVIGEAKLNLHLTDVLRLPISLSYANRETQTIKQGWQLNVGVNALLDEVLRSLK
jgi:hypothetical protein